MKVISLFLISCWAALLSTFIVSAELDSITYQGWGELNMDDREKEASSRELRSTRGLDSSTRYTSLRHRNLGKSMSGGKSMGKSGSRGKSGKSSSSSRSDQFQRPRRMRMRPTRAPLPDMGLNNTEAPTMDAGNETAAPIVDDPFRTRPPRQPRRMRQRTRQSRRQRPFFSGKSMGKSSSSPSSRSGPLVLLRVQAQMTYEFFENTGMNPSNAEINALVDETEDYFWDALDANRLTRGWIGDFAMTNLAAQFAPNGDLDTFSLFFDAVASTPIDSPIFAEDIARIMANSNFNRYIQFYVWEAEPFTENIFWQVNAVDFEGRAINVAG